MNVAHTPFVARAFRGMRIGLKVAALVLVLCGLSGALLHVHHGSGSETCAVCVHARAPVTTTPPVSLPVSLQLSGEIEAAAEDAIAPVAIITGADPRAPPRTPSA